MSELSSIDGLRSALREAPVPVTTAPDIARIKAGALHRRRRTMITFGAGTAIAGVAAAVWLPGVAPEDEAIANQPPTDSSRFIVGSLAPFGCEPGAPLEITEAPLTDGSPPAAIEPLQQIDQLLESGFIYQPAGSIIVDDSGLTADPAYVLVGSAADGTTAQVEFVLASNGNWAFNGMSQCVPTDDG